MSILVSLSMDMMGNITAIPVSYKHREKYAAHMKQMGEHPTSTAFFQEGGPAAAFLADLETRCTRGKQYVKDLNSGFTVTIRMESEEFGHWLGHDACEVKL